MKILLTLLAAVWMLLPLSATATPAMAETAPCHSDSTLTHTTPDRAPLHGPGVMPCCAQPMATPSPAHALPLLRRSVTARLSPATAAPLASLCVGLEPRPPKNL